MRIIQESGIEFGPFDDDAVFHIEKSRLFTEIGSGVKAAEFLLYRLHGVRVPSIWIVEAKSSMPRRDGENGAFDRFITEVCAKFEDTFELYAAMRLGRHANYFHELPVALSNADLSIVQFRFLLVITTARPEWLGPVQDALSHALARRRRVWALKSSCVAVLTADDARRFDLVVRH
jgi:hypothetical protein